MATTISACIRRSTAMVLIVAAVTGCAYAWSPEEYSQVLKRYGPACERAGFIVSSDDWARCAVYSAGGEPIPPSPETLEQRLMRQYGERCQLAGFKPGTGAFGQCLLSYGDRDEAMRKAIAAQLLMQMYGQQAAAAQRPNLVPLPMQNQVTCTSLVGNQLITTTCR